MVVLLILRGGDYIPLLYAYQQTKDGCSKCKRSPLLAGKLLLDAIRNRTVSVHQMPIAITRTSGNLFSKRPILATAISAAPSIA